MKKGMKAVISMLLATSCCATALAFTGCGKTDKPDDNPPACTEHVDGDNNGKCDNCGEDMPKDECTEHVDANGDGKCDNCGEPVETTPEEDEWLISIVGQTVRDIDIDSADETVKYTVFKNGDAVTGEQVEIELDGTSVELDKATGKLTPKSIGDTKITISLVGKEDVAPATVTVRVHKYFFAHDASLTRGNVSFANEDSATEPYVTVAGGQASVLVKKASNKFVYKCALTVDGNADIVSGASFGLASFHPVGAEAGDNALWFGLRNSNGVSDGVFSLYRRSFYKGWSTDVKVDGTEEGYDAIDTGTSMLECVIIRDGADYYYSIDGFYGKLTDDSLGADTATYAGVYSQNIPLEIAEYEFSDDADDVAAAIAEYYTNRTVAAVVIGNSFINEIVKGESATYTAAAYPKDRASGAEFEWSLDKAEMTAGADGTEIADGVLRLADDAAGYVTVICGVKNTDVQKRLRVRILAESLDAENDMLNAYGGVVIEDDGAILFPTSLMSRTGINRENIIGHNEDRYIETPYCAVLKNRYSRDYSMQFKFSNYVVGGGSPKLQISLGADFANVYIVYNNGRLQFQTNMYGTGVAGKTTNGWYNSDFVNNFDPAAEHTVKISVSARGVYTIELDGVVLPLTLDETHERGTISRLFSAYSAKTPIKFASQHCSVRLYDIRVTDGASALPTFYSANSNYTFEGDDGFTMLAGGVDGWGYRGYPHYYTEYTGTLGESFAAELDVIYGAAFDDGKLAMRIGDGELHFNNSKGALSVQYVYNMEWGTSPGNISVPVDDANPLKMHLRVERWIDGGVCKLRVIANGKIVLNDMSGMDRSAEMKFYMFNQNAEDARKTVSLANFTVGEYSRADVYELVAQQRVEIKVGDAALALPCTIKLNGANATLGEGQTLTAEIIDGDDEFIKLDADGKVYAENITGEAVKSVVVRLSLKDGAGKLLAFADVGVYASNRATENNAITVKGGVLLNGASSDNWSLTFPEDMRGTNGVGSEFEYEDNDYAAVFKERVTGDFSLEFTVSDYKTDGREYPKLLVSLGGKHNQFFIAYNRQNTVNWVESWTRGIKANGEERIEWNNSDEFASFDPAAPHTFKFEVVGGFYRIYLDGAEVAFGGTKLVRTNYGEACPIRFGTSGVSAQISNVKLTKGAVTGKTYSVSNVTNVSDDGFTLTFGASGFDANRYVENGNRIMYFNGPTGAQTLEFDLAFGAKMSDSKFGIVVGGSDDVFYIENKLAGDGVIRLCNKNWDYAEDIALSALADLHVKIVRNGGDATFTLTCDGKSVTKTWSGVDGGVSTLSFWGFNSNAGEANITATVSNLVITDN